MQYIPEVDNIAINHYPIHNNEFIHWQNNSEINKTFIARKNTL